MNTVSVTAGYLAINIYNLSKTSIKIYNWYNTNHWTTFTCNIKLATYDYFIKNDFEKNIFKVCEQRQTTKKLEWRQ